MTPVLVDSNVIPDVIAAGSRFFSWSQERIERLADEVPLLINLIVFTEVSIQFATMEAAERALPHDLYRREPIPWDAAFLAGKCFLDYRRRGGARISPLPDFYIGAHVAVRGYRLLTRDARRYRIYFPSLELIAPA
jgi:predicted nucleic acid-binding protein